MIGKLSTMVLALGGCACFSAQAQTPGWTTAYQAGSPAVLYGGGDKVSFLLRCSPQTWSLGIMIPSNDLSVSGLVDGEIDAGEVVQLHFRGGNPGGKISVYAAGTRAHPLANDEVKVPEAIAALLKSKQPFSIRIGSYTATFPIEGFAEAMAPLRARCGEPGKFFDPEHQTQQ